MEEVEVSRQASKHPKPSPSPPLPAKSCTHVSVPRSRLSVEGRRRRGWMTMMSGMGVRGRALVSTRGLWRVVVWCLNVDGSGWVGFDGGRRRRAADKTQAATDTIPPPPAIRLTS